ncbi:PepSY domain-containing protein [Pseudomonas baetica]|uniref:PepSY domain-containing protein n=1 Tax=Pseudomonas baetica TaxID=674054 RepID=UPI003EF03EF2
MKPFLLHSSTRIVGRVALVLVAFCSVALARDLDQDEALRLRQQGVILPLEQVLHNALDRYPGAKLLEAELEEKHGVYMYEVELLTTEGVVRELDLDATTGRLLKDKED